MGVAMQKYFDMIVVFCFSVMLFLTLSMWINYDKLQHRLEEQRKIITELIYENQSLISDKELINNLKCCQQCGICSFYVKELYDSQKEKTK